MIERLFDLHVRDRGFTAAFLTAYPGAIDFTATREQALTTLAGLARRAKEAGRLRRDFVLEDLVLVLMAVGGLRATSQAGAVAAARRFAALAVEGFRAGGDVTPLPPAVRLPVVPVR